MSLSVDKCLQAWTNSLKQMNAKADIVFFGDSLTYYGDFSSVFPNKVVCNLGLRGDTIQGMIERVEQIAILEPQKVFLMAGINDVAHCNSMQFKEKYEYLIRQIKDIIPQTDLVIQSLLPVNDRAFMISCNNNQIRECCKEIESLAIKYNLSYLDLLSLYMVDDVLPERLTKDGLHLHSDSYKRWYHILYNTI